MGGLDGFAAALAGLAGLSALAGLGGLASLGGFAGLAGDGDVEGVEPGRLGGVVVGLGLRLALRRDAADVGVDLALLLGRVPAEDVGHQVGDLRGGGHAAVPGLDRGPGPPGQHVVHVAGVLVGDRVAGLDREVVVGAGQR